MLVLESSFARLLEVVWLISLDLAGPLQVRGGWNMMDPTVPAGSRDTADTDGLSKELDPLQSQQDNFENLPVACIA